MNIDVNKASESTLWVLRLVVGGLALAIAVMMLLDVSGVDIPRFSMQPQSFAYLMAGVAAILWGARG